jgi:hypothetical protein
MLLRREETTVHACKHAHMQRVQSCRVHDPQSTRRTYRGSPRAAGCQAEVLRLL